MLSDLGSPQILQPEPDFLDVAFDEVGRVSALVLVGAPGTGKTSVVGELARLGWNTADAGAVATTMRALTVEDLPAH